MTIGVLGRGVEQHNNTVDHRFILFIMTLKERKKFQTDSQFAVILTPWEITLNKNTKNILAQLIFPIVCPCRTKKKTEIFFYIQQDEEHFQN